uniref:Uncharacterized protein n=1 Tax=Anopheles culicifacies TaxID=139723 RepID=A0A182MH12_9DIPT
MVIGAGASRFGLAGGPLLNRAVFASLPALARSLPKDDPAPFVLYGVHHVMYDHPVATDAGHDHAIEILSIATDYVYHDDHDNHHDNHDSSDDPDTGHHTLDHDGHDRDTDHDDPGHGDFVPDHDLDWNDGGNHHLDHDLDSNSNNSYDLLYYDCYHVSRHNDEPQLKIISSMKPYPPDSCLIPFAVQ